MSLRSIYPLISLRAFPGSSVPDTSSRNTTDNAVPDCLWARL